MQDSTSIRQKSDLQDTHTQTHRKQARTKHTPQHNKHTQPPENTTTSIANSPKGLNKATAKADSTLRCSQAVPHPSTNRALCRLTSEVKRDPVHSTRYGRQRNCVFSYSIICFGNSFFNFKQHSSSRPSQRQIGLRDRNSPKCTLSQNGYGDPKVFATYYRH